MPTILDRPEREVVDSTARSIFPVSGKIRSGIMVPSKRTMENKKAMAIYEDGVEKNVDFKRIAAKIEKVCNVKNPLYPTNTEFFTVRPSDFKIPESADQILEMYGEDRGDGVRLYRFPVVLPSDNWQEVMPHQYIAYGATGPRYWSSWSPDEELLCLTYAAVEKGRRYPHGRPIVTRPDFNGRCLPDECPEYQRGECNLTASILVYIPGIHGAGVIAVTTHSPYAIHGARRMMETIGHQTGGRIGGVPFGTSMFYLTKREEDLSRIDRDKGSVTRTKQWIVTLDSAIDMPKLLAAKERGALEARGAEAIALLEGASTGVSTPQKMATVAPLAPPPEPQAGVDYPEGDDDVGEVVDEPEVSVVEELGIFLDEHDVSRKAFNDYATDRWGAEWKESVETISIASKWARDLVRLTGNAEALQKEIDAGFVDDGIPF